jgi:hypothetical protein
LCPKICLERTGLILVGAFVVVIIFYTLNFIIVTYFSLTISIHDLAFIEGIFFILLGISFLLGSGGLSPATLKELFFASAADVVTDESYAPSDILRREVWKTRGKQKLGLILVFSGIILIVLYFLLARSY